MKRIIVITALLTVLLQAYAQNIEGSITIKARENILTKLPEQAAYLLPAFTDAVVTGRDGSLSSGRVNVCLVDNSVRFITDSGDTLLMSNAENVSRIVFADTVLLQVQDYFVKQMVVYGQKSIAERRQLKLTQQAESAGYSSIPAVSTAKKGTMVALDPTYVYEAETDYDYRMTTDLVLTDGTEVYSAKLSSFVKVFPDRKKEIRSFVKEHRTDFNDKQDLADLFFFCIGEQK